MLVGDLVLVFGLVYDNCCFGVFWFDCWVSWCSCGGFRIVLVLSFLGLSCLRMGWPVVFVFAVVGPGVGFGLIDYVVCCCFGCIVWLGGF